MSFIIKSIILLFCLNIWLLSICEGAKILILPAPVAASHKKSMLPLAALLGKRGHNVTVWMPMIRDLANKPVTLPNVSDVEPLHDSHWQLVKDIFVHKNRTDMMDFWNMAPMQSHHVMIPWVLCSYLCHEALTQLNDTMEALVQERWDLVVMDAFFTTCAYGIVEKSGASFIQQSTTVLYPHNKRNSAIPKPINAHLVNHVAYDVTKFTHRIHAVLFNDIVDPLCEVVINLMINFVLGTKWLSTRWFTLGKFEPGADVVFDMSPHSIAIAMPRTPTQFMIGDQPCIAPESRLPPDYEAFVNDPTSKGTIIAAFGHMLSWKVAPKKLVTAFEQAFRRLVDEGYRVVWQFDGPPMDLPLGIMLVKWLPQITLLNHPKSKVFISHCGLKSVMEGICSKCPVLAFPVFAEQHYNAQLLTFHHNGGESIDKLTTTGPALYDKIMGIIDNYESHHNELGRIGAMMEDKIMPDIDIAAFWVDFSINHSDDMAKLKVRGTKLCLLSYFCLDIVGTLFGAFALIGYTFYQTVCKTCVG